MDRQKWLEERRTGIGGSDVAAILGLDDYSSPYSVWADKLGLLPEKEDNEAMRQGRDLEAYVAQRFTELTGKKVRRFNRSLVHPEHSFMRANVDRLVVGENAGLECKTTSVMNLKHYQDGEYPQRFYCQCLHYMAVTGKAKWYLAVLILNQGFHVFEITRNDGEIAWLINAERHFWDYVENKYAPPMDGSNATTEALSSIYNTAVDGSVNLCNMEQDFIEIAALNEQLKTIEQEKERFKQRIKSAMGENTRAECSAWVANWKPNKNGTRVFIIKEKMGA